MKIFISHTESNSDLSRGIAQGLAERGFDVWFDEWQIHPGDNWAKKLGVALERADVMVAVVPENGIEGRWQTGEIQYALTTPRFKGRLIPVVSRRTPLVPWMLSSPDVVRPARSREETIRRVVAALEKTAAEQTS